MIKWQNIALTIVTSATLLALPLGVIHAQGQRPTGLETVSGTIMQVNGDTLTLATRQATLMTVTFSGTTQFVAGSYELSSVDLAAGERVTVRGLGNYDSVTAMRVMFTPVTLRGSVTAVDGQALTLATTGGATYTVILSTVTREYPPDPIIVAGDRLSVFGVGAANSVDAIIADVTLPPPVHLVGTVISMGLQAFTLAIRGPAVSSSTAVTVTLSPTTHIHGTIADGDRVAVVGTEEGSTVRAEAVSVIPLHEIVGTLTSALTVTVMTAYGPEQVTLPAGSRLDVHGSMQNGTFVASHLVMNAPDLQRRG